MDNLPKFILIIVGAGILIVMLAFGLKYFNLNSFPKKTQNIQIITKQSPTPKVTLSCPVPKEFCSKGKSINEGANFNGLGFNLPKGTPFLAAFDGEISDQPKNTKADPKKPVLYLRDSKGNEIVYSYVGTVSAKLESNIKAGTEVGKIGEGTFPPVAPFAGLNFFFGLKQNGTYQTITINNFSGII